MRILPTLLFAGAALGLAGAAAYAAEAPNVHVLTIRLPGGGVEQIRYTGPEAPQVIVRDGPMTAVDLDGPNSPFAMMARLQAEMDRQIAALMRLPTMRMPLSAPTPGSVRLEQANMAAMPAGSQSISVVSTVSGGHACTQTVRMTSEGPGKAPQVVSSRTGDCAAAAPAFTPLVPGAPSRTTPAATRPSPPGARTSI
ncbi:MAG TPA: hypothetical protein VKU90_13760 [Caulobacteraceae bacterium]|nr:hypothetical protein [Caulobacteraceae bacterium]